METNSNDVDSLRARQNLGDGITAPIDGPSLDGYRLILRLVFIIILSGFGFSSEPWARRL